MIIIRLTGGLGNQMFQYAYGRSCSIKNKESLKYFFVHYCGDTNRKYELGIFNIVGNKINGFFPDILVKIDNLFRLNFPNIKYGYWQSEKYFKEYEKEIRKDFTFMEPLSGENKIISDEIRKTNSVSLHIRRGDYITSKITNKFHGTCCLGYYKKAMKLINKKVKNPKYFVFSDDIYWVKKNLEIKNAFYVDDNVGDKSYIDMQLMSMCKHNIIANSSFSWWAAWLNNNPNKIVIAPKKWFNDPGMDTTDLISEEWIRF